jgi:hypothetical protein
MSEQVAFGARVILMIEGAGAIDHGLGSKACFALVACVGNHVAVACFLAWFVSRFSH